MNYLKTNEPKFTDFKEDYSKLIGQMVGVYEYGKWRFGKIISVTKTGFKTDITNDTIFKFENGRVRGENYGSEYAELFNDEKKAAYAELASRDKEYRDNIYFITNFSSRNMSYAQAKAIRKILEDKNFKLS